MQVIIAAKNEEKIMNVLEKNYAHAIPVPNRIACHRVAVVCDQCPSALSLVYFLTPASPGIFSVVNGRPNTLVHFL
jgi:hypothetical protein